MLHRFVVITSLAAGTAIAVTVAFATPALAKGATLASITGPGLGRPITISEPGQSEAMPGGGDTLSNLAEQTGLFTVLFGGSGSGTSDQPSPLRTPPGAGALGPKYTLSYTVPGVTPGPGQANGQIRQDLYPRAVGGPVIYTPEQPGFDQPLQASGWFRGTPQLTATLTRLGVPAHAQAAHAQAAHAQAAHAPAAAPKPRDTTAPAWLIATILPIAAIAIAATALWLRRRSRSSTGQPVTNPGRREDEQRAAIP